jgi:SAM-dependent methyltransferase
MASDLWEQHASWWHREFTDGADAEYEQQILPMVEHYAVGARRLLDIGCGEGQVARRLSGQGVNIVVVDLTASQIQLACQRGGSARFVRAAAEGLPFVDAAFDTVVLCLAIEHVEPFEAALEEVARVLIPGGRFLFLLAHPLLQSPGSGWVELIDSDEQFWRVGSYLEDDISIDEVGPGVRLSFAHRPLSRYVHEMGRCGLLIDDMVEPAPPPTVLLETGGFPNASSIPRLMLLSALRTGA